jgi:hypothetical protein
MWEDDTESCQPAGGRPPKTDDPDIPTLLALAAGTFFFAAYAIDIGDQAFYRAGATLTGLWGLHELYTSFHKDDLVGLVDIQCWPADSGPATFPVKSLYGFTWGYVSLDFRGLSRDPICAPPPPPPPLTAYVSGPSVVFVKGAYTWSAVPDGGTGGYTYRWRMRPVGGSWTTLGTGQNQNAGVYGGDPDFDLELRVEAGSETVFDTLRVVNCIGGAACN